MFNNIIIPAKFSVKILLFLMHGYGTNCHDLADIGELVANKYAEFGIEIHVLNAFEEIPGGLPGQYQWFSLSSTKYRDMKSQINIAGEKLIKCINDIIKDVNSKQEQQISWKNVVLAGFSQGGMMALHAGLANNASGIISFSGCLVDESVIATGCSSKILMTHGALDEVMPKIYLDESITALKQKNLTPAIHIENNMSHSINQECIIKAYELIDQVLSSL